MYIQEECVIGEEMCLVEIWDVFVGECRTCVGEECGMCIEGEWPMCGMGSVLQCHVLRRSVEFVVGQCDLWG